MFAAEAQPAPGAADDGKTVLPGLLRIRAPGRNRRLLGFQ